MNQLPALEASRFLNSAFPGYTAPQHLAHLDDGPTSCSQHWSNCETLFGWAPAFHFLSAFTHPKSAQVIVPLRMFNHENISVGQDDLVLDGGAAPVDRSSALYISSGQIARIKNNASEFEDVLLCNKLRCTSCYGFSLQRFHDNGLGGRPFVHIMDLMPLALDDSIEQRYDGKTRTVDEDLPIHFASETREVMFADLKWRLVTVCNVARCESWREAIELLGLDRENEESTTRHVETV